MDLRVFIEPQQGASYAQQLAVARAAEEGGFDAFFRSDHYLRMGPGSPLPGPTDSWITLAGIARETSRIRLGTLVTSATFRLPGVLAISVAQVDEMSGGRVELGLGAGWFTEEHAGYGIPFPATTERFDRLTEQLAIITGLWGTPVGESFSHQGEHYTLTDSPALPKPVQRPHPPIIIGGHGATRTPALAARYASEFNVPFASADRTAAQFARVRQAAETAGRNPDELVYSAALVLCCGRDEAELKLRAERIGRDLGELRENGLAGTPAEVVEKLTAYGPGGAGASRIYLQLLDLTDLDHLALVAAEVAPHL
ncbi:probable F420-dependent oxidoreductase, Rv1855c family [Parafrankia irregularis]|uniref:Probable F420-dependent oxidoreductase, Rv1855c family n=1 Tax=Parafrankia irregularis TaxID=795642 RepID=A0A0S4QN34_9ACTN|nr:MULTISPECIES: LLM class F420-dependent oxidoreductase [Parafrankia]MBE3200519.1 LLM class F420-dependent oxidoreductase [Parafrankia sp. CH37]CUU56851.1 probable F420-dependent oxidoreductase, Rv1855c family [Parafrankia irregularis]